MFAWIAKRTGVQLPSPPFLISSSSKRASSFSNEHERKRPWQFLQCLVALAKGSISRRRTSVWCNSLTRAFTLPRRRPSESPTGLRRCSPRGLASNRCIGRSVTMTKCASSRHQTTRQLPACYYPQIYWAISGRRRCALSPALRWRRFSQIFPDRSAWERLRQGRTLAFWQL